MSLRDRRRAQLRQQLSDTATELFLERGFDEVTVGDVATACGVTEKTVFNHFRTKEALLIDRWPHVLRMLGERLADAAVTPLDGVVTTIHDELDVLTAHGRADRGHMALVARFGTMIETTPALRDHRRRCFDQVVETLHAGLAARRAVRADPELRVAAIALSGLFDVFSRSLGRTLTTTEDAARARTRVRADVRRAARVLATLPVLVTTPDTDDQRHV